VFLILASAPSVARSAEEQPQATPDPWRHLRRLVGTWQGAIDGPLGTGTGSRTYEFVLRDRYLMARHSSVRLPQPKSPKGDNHEEIAIFSHDRSRDTIVLRQFVVEGFVNEYDCVTGPDSVVCTTTHVEGMEGISARWTVWFMDGYAFEERFELAWPGETSRALFDRNRWTRVPDASR
jgi:hypothetical protein